MVVRQAAAGGLRRSKPVPFGSWSPDAPTLGASQIIRNVVPGEDGSYRPFPGFDALDDSSQAIAESFTEGFVAWAGDGAIDVIAATEANLYRWDGDAWTSALGSLTDGEWRFAQWGDEILATNPTHGFYHANIGGTFSADATPPKARLIARIENRVVLGHLDGTPNALRWSGFNDRSAWTIGDPATGSDIEYRPREYGALTGLKGGTLQNSVVFQERAISRLTRHPDFVFGFEVVEEELGCAASRSIQSYGGLTFFVSQEGPALFDGQRAKLLGDGTFRRWFQDTLDGVTQSPIYSAIDKKNKIVTWYWQPDSADPVSQGVIYNWAEDRAAEWRPGAAYPLVFSVPSSIADTNVLTTTTIGSYSGDALQTRTSGAVDRPRLSENALIIGSIDPTTKKLGRFNGSSMEATLETPEWMADPSARNAPSPKSVVSMPFVIGNAPPTSLYMTMTSRGDAPGDTEEVGAETQGHAAGHIPVPESEGRTHKGSLRIPASTVWRHVQGVQFPYVETSER